MNYEIKDLSSVKKEIAVNFPKEEVNEQFKENYKRVAQTVNFNGFRKGRVPEHVVKMKHGRAVKDEVERFFLNQGVQDPVRKEELKVIAEPDMLDKSTLKEGDDFSFKFAVEIFPEIDINVKDYTLEYTPVEYNDNMLEEEMKEFKKSLMSYEKKEGPAEKGDKVVISFQGKDENGENIENTAGEKVPVTLGEKSFIKSFEDALFGKKAGDSFEEKIDFPEDYKAEDLAGKSILFSIEVHDVESPEKDFELNDEFLKEKQGYPDTVTEVRELLEKKIKNYIEKANADNKSYLVADRYVKENDFEIPPTFLNAEKDIRKKQWKNENKQDNIPEDKLESIEKEAVWSAKRFIILSQLAQNLQVSVSDEELDREFENDAKRFGISVDQMKQYIGKNKIDEKRIMLQEKKVLDKLAEKANFVEEKNKEEDDDSGKKDTEEKTDEQN